jgi:hypothetical protein
MQLVPLQRGASYLQHPDIAASYLALNSTLHSAQVGAIGGREAIRTQDARWMADQFELIRQPRPERWGGGKS